MSISRVQDNLFETSTMTFGQHLEELRRCLFKAIYGLALGCLVGFLVGDHVMRFVQSPVEKALLQFREDEAEDKVASPEELKMLAEAGYTKPSDVEWIQNVVKRDHLSIEVVSIDKQPPDANAAPDASAAVATTVDPKADPALRLTKKLQFHPIANDSGTQMIAGNSQEAFMIWMEASVVVGVILASPWIFYQIWQFVGAGLYPHERRYVHIFLPASVLLFLAGAAIAFFFAFERVLNFLLSFNRHLHISPYLRISEWMSFVLLLPLGFGISFQLPLVMLFLERIGLLTVKSYLASWRMAVLIIFVLAMLLTPSPDPYSMCLLAGPLTALYFSGVLLCKLFPRTISRAA